MKLFGILLLFFSPLFSDSFITDMEYGKMLYENPRGIGCNKCHGNKGEGSIIAVYKDFNNTTKVYETKRLIAPSIKDIPLVKYIQAINETRDVMPNYSLTRDEIIVLYNYINKKK